MGNGNQKEESETMNHQHQRSTDVMSTYAGDQSTVVTGPFIDRKRVVNPEPARATPQEVKEIFAAFELEMQTPDEMEEFLRAWESMPDEALLIY